MSAFAEEHKHAKLSKLQMTKTMSADCAKSLSTSTFAHLSDSKT